MTDSEARLIIQKIDNIEILEICMRSVQEKLEELQMRKDSITSPRSALAGENVVINGRQQKFFAPHGSSSGNEKEKKLLSLISKEQELEDKYNYYKIERDKALELRNNVVNYHYDWDFDRQFVYARFIKGWRKNKLMLEFNEGNPSRRLISIVKKTNISLI